MGKVILNDPQPHYLVGVGKCLRLTQKIDQAMLGNPARIEYTQCFQKVFTPLNICHLFLCYSLNLKWIKFKFFVTDLYKIPHNDEVKKYF